jgi:CRP-like cAMP-binding protein
MMMQPSDRNLFLSVLPAPESVLLQSHLAPCELRLGDCLHYIGEPIEDVVFPNSGLVALTVPQRDDAGPGVILIGRDGIVGGFAATASAPATCDAEVHIAGQALRMPASAFRDLLDQNAIIRRIAARFDTAMLAQAQQTVLCNAAHAVEARICRWLLEIQDRCGDGKVPLTQSTLAQMLGVRRTTVTLVAGRLEAMGVLHCRRGYMQIVSHAELERHSCGCYSHVRGYMRQLFDAPGGANGTAIDAATHLHAGKQAV